MILQYNCQKNLTNDLDVDNYKIAVDVFYLNRQTGHIPSNSLQNVVATRNWSGELT